MAGYIVTVKHNGKHYDIKVSDAEIRAKFASFCQNCPQLADDVEEYDIAEMVAYDKVEYAVALTQDSRQSWTHGYKCALCGAGHRMVTAVLTNATLANVQNGMSIGASKYYICEKCFETEFTTCSKCHRDLPNQEIMNGLCSLCQGDEAGLVAKRVRVS